jgi:outer membrane protein TolC
MRTASLCYVLAGVLLILAGLPSLRGQSPPPANPDFLPPVAARGDGVSPRCVLQGPITSSSSPVEQLPAQQPTVDDQALPINLATALRLADARPLVIAAAQASARQALAAVQGADVLWLPNAYLGASWFRHDGGEAGNSGQLFVNGRNQILAGGGLALTVEAADAIFAPLALRQVLRSREIDIQSARNDALLNVAEAWFNVQQARGRLAGAQDAVDKARQLAVVIRKLGRDLAPPIEADRARTELADVEQTATQAYEDWRIASADLTRVLRLRPGAVVVPMEPPHLQITLFSPQESVDALIPIGLTNRPELASQQALVQATLVRLRQEKLRPLIPSLLIQGDNGRTAPGQTLMGGVFYNDLDGHSSPLTGRNDMNVQVLWELRNMGLGNLALVRERRAENDRALIELYRIQDQVAAEVAQAHAQVQSAALRTRRAEVEVREAQTTYAGNLKGLSQTTRFGDLFTLVTRPQEAVAALQLLMRAYNNYFTSVNQYNRAQFRLYRALGYPATILECERSPGPIVPVDTSRPPEMPPVCAPPPCSCPPK